MQFVDIEAPSGDLSQEKKRVELELPTVMKIWRNRNSKYVILYLLSCDSALIHVATFRYLSILYNDEAAASESSQDECAGFRGCGLYLSPVLFDAEVRLWFYYSTSKAYMHFGRRFTKLH
jgi:hypothetical protein